MHCELPLLPATRAFLERKLKMRIGADWQDAASGRTMSFRNPATGEVLGKCPRPTRRMWTAQSKPRARLSTTRPGAACAHGSGRTCCGAWPI